MSENADEDDEESVGDLWKEVDEFAETDPDDAEIREFIEATPTDSEPDELTEAELTDTEPDTFSETEPTDTESDTFDETEPTGTEFEVPNTESDGQLSEADEAPDTDEVFDEMGVDEIDGEALWDELAGAETDAGSFDGEEATETAERLETDAEPVGTGSEPDKQATRADSEPADTETVVNKRAYCQQCPFFTDPPEVRCTHEGTEIIEVHKDGQFRVSNCPVVTDSGPNRTILNDEH